MYCRPEVSRKIRYMSFFAAVSVVWLHTNPIGYIEGVIPCWVGLLGAWLNHFNDWAVPFFFVVSGFFFDRQCAESFRYGDILRKKFHSLVIPYLFWGCVWGGFLWTPLWMLTNSRNGLPVFANTFLAGGNVLCSVDFLVGFVCNGPANPVLWFMRMLIIVFLTAPLWIGLRRLSKWLLMGLALSGVFVFTPVSVVIPAEKLFSIYGYPFVLKCQGVAWFGVGMAVSAFRLEERRIHWSAVCIGWIGWWACWHFGACKGVSVLYYACALGECGWVVPVSPARGPCVDVHILLDLLLPRACLRMARRHFAGRTGQIGRGISCSGVNALGGDDFVLSCVGRFDAPVFAAGLQNPLWRQVG